MKISPLSAIKYGIRTSTAAHIILYVIIRTAYSMWWLSLLLFFLILLFRIHALQEVYVHKVLKVIAFVTTKSMTKILILKYENRRCINQLLRAYNCRSRCAVHPACNSGTLNHVHCNRFVLFQNTSEMYIIYFIVIAVRHQISTRR